MVSDSGFVSSTVILVMLVFWIFRSLWQPARYLRINASNLEMIMAQLRSLSYEVIYQRLKAHELGLPQRRVRLYFFGIRASESLAEPICEIMKKIPTRLQAMQCDCQPPAAGSHELETLDLTYYSAQPFSESHHVSEARTIFFTTATMTNCVRNWLGWSSKQQRQLKRLRQKDLLPLANGRRRTARWLNSVPSQQ